MTAPNFLEIALKYYDMGFSVIPIVAGKKDPSYVKWTTYQTTKASKEEIIEWWTKWPKANIAIVTGKLSNLFVADLDKYKKEYSEELALQFFPDSLLTATSLSPQKGEHLYFSFPENFKVGGRSDQKLAIDFRAEGNYIVAPPSVNGNGIAYRWLNSIFDTPLAPVPDAYILYNLLF